QVTAFPVRAAGDKAIGVGVIAQDVTERERADEALRDSEEYLRSVLDNSPDCVKVLSLDGRLVEMNRPGRGLMEIDDFEEFRGRAWAELWPDGEEVARRAVATAAGGTVARFQGPTNTAKGTPKYWDVQVAPVPGPDGRPARLVCVSRDVTEQRRVEEAVRHSEATLRAFYDNSPLNMGVVELTYDGDMKHVYDNAASCRFFGVGPGETAGKLASALGVPPDTIAVWRKHYRQSAATREAARFDYTFDAPNGARWLAVTVSTVPTPAGTPTRYCYVAEDVTERQRAEREVRMSEARFRTLVTAVPQIVWVARPDGSREYSNAKWYEFTGMTEAESVGWGWADALHPDDRADSEAKWRRTVETGEVFEIARRYRRADGEYRWFLGRALPQRDENGAIVRWFGTSTDIHDAKLAEEALAERARLAALRADVATALGSDADVPAVLRRCCDALVTHLDAAFARVWTLDRAGEVLELRASAGLYTHTDGPHGRVKVGEFKIGRIAESRVALLTNDVPNDPNVSDPAWARREGMVAFAGHPLLVEGRVLGVVALFSGRPFTPELTADLGPLADSVAQYLDRKNAAEALRERDADFRIMAESIPTLAWMARPDGHIFWYNKRWYDYTGTTPEAMEGWGWKSVHDPDVLPSVLEQWQNSIDTGAPFEMVFPLKGADDRFRPFLTRVHPAKEGGRVVRWFGTNTDITDQLEAADRLRASEERFRTLTEAVPNIVWNADADGAATYFNTRWVEYTGVTVKDVADVGPYGWLVCVHPDDHDRVAAAWRDTVTKVGVGPDDRFAHEVRLRRAGTDEYRWFLSVAIPLRRPDGSVDQWIGSMADIHDQKTAAERVRAAAERFRTLTETVPQIVWTADPKGEVTFFNRRWGEYTGLPPADRAPGWGQVVHPDDSTRVNTSWQLAVAQAADHYAQQFRLRAADGEYRWMLSNAIPLRTPAGEIAEWVGSLTDIDDQKQAAQNLERTVRDRTAQLELTNLQLTEEVAERTRAEELVTATARELKRSNEELEQFAYIASHDLQEPLRKIQSFGDLLKTKYREQLPDGGKEYTDKMLNSAGRMRRLIDDLLSLSRVTSQGKPYTRVDLTELVNQVKSDLDLRIDQAGGTVDVGSLPAIDADPSQIRQLFQNLILNALKFHKPGVAPVVLVRGEVLPGDAGECRLTVEDNGIGFEEKYRDRIFQVFQRLHGRDEYEGTGVGLAICQKIVERHGGTIAAQGRPGEGATFVITLPVRQPTTEVPDNA
ncbi:MAG TPA: PAS domain S-box protein, partial [Gemmataceae bacterium]|nr:PAS domain S-box protein [Gemmataceae bacterium]